REAAREKIAAETHRSQSQSQSFSHSRANSNDISYVRIEEGPQFSFGGNGNVLSRNYQSNGGPFGDVCDNANVVQGGLNVAFKGRRTVEAYNNNSASSSSTSTSSASASSLNQSGNQFGNANNQNQQNQNSQQSSGRRQPTYNPDPDPHNGKARTSDGF
ncbi:MAG: hypothetical protein RL687_242, partial [Candidatus Parcubacteria bacterium]